MASTHVDIEQAEWTPGTPFYGPAAHYDGKDIVQLKVLSDRRAEGGATKSGAPARASGGYTLNPTGQPHSAMIAAETVSLIVYSGEPDRIVSMEVIDVSD
jgi:hypothetical protein